jgi:NTE family protein
MKRQSGNGRTAVVLGAGGFLGAAWTLGALSAVQQTAGFDVSGADLIVGTSAGSVLAMMLRAGLTVEQLCDAQLAQDSPAQLSASARSGTDIPDAPLTLPDFNAEADWRLPRPGLGSLPLLMHALRNPFRVAPAALCSALVPKGRRRLTSIGGLIDALHDGRDWPTGTHIVATDFQTGSRAVFGRGDGPRVSPARAVMASCAVPGWYEPVEVREVPYIDGAVYSPCSVDLLEDAGCDEVYVLAPMASVEPDRPTTTFGRLERAWRRIATNRTLAEVRKVRATGARVHLLTPDADDLTVMGANMMDVERRADVLLTAREGMVRRLGIPAAQQSGRLHELAGRADGAGIGGGVGAGVGAGAQQPAEVPRHAGDQSGVEGSPGDRPTLTPAA